MLARWSLTSSVNSEVNTGSNLMNQNLYLQQQERNAKEDYTERPSTKRKTKVLNWVPTVQCVPESITAARPFTMRTNTFSSNKNSTGFLFPYRNKKCNSKCWFYDFFSLYFCLWKRFSRQGWHLCCHFLLFIAGKTAARENSTQCRKQRKRSCDDLKDLRCASSSNTDSYNENLSSLALKLMAILIKHTRTPPMSLIALFGKEMQILLINKMTNLFPKWLPALEVFTKTLITSATRYC